jgi:hypothetical protein
LPTLAREAVVAFEEKNVVAAKEWKSSLAIEKKVNETWRS